jgi:pimeloyl-ACP methyl ester carboxylesterase
MTAFGLIHGGCHGAWCWDLLIPELEARGHTAVAIDLPITDAAVGASGCADIVVDRLADVTDRLVLVGHSMGGLVAPLVPSRRSVDCLVFLCAVLPEPGLSLMEQVMRDGLINPAAFPMDDDGHIVCPPQTAIDSFYHDCPPGVAAWAAERLRPQTLTLATEITPILRWPDVDFAYVRCVDDRVVDPDWQVRAAKERLDVHTIDLPGGHSPFLSRPAALANILTTLPSGQKP